MTDKIKKIREEVERMHNLLPVMDGGNISVNYADRICTTLEMYIDSLQEEPKQEVESNPDFKKPSLVIRKGEKYFCIKDYHDKNCTFTRGKIYRSDKDGFLIDDEDKNTFERKIWEEDACEYFIPSLQKEPKFKVGDTVRYKYNHIHTKPRIIAEICGFSHYVDTDGCRMDMAYTDANFKLVEEPVSEDLHTAAKEYANSITEKTGYRLQLRRAFVYGAKWQKEKMMSKAIDGDITFDYYGDDDKTYGCIAHDSFCLEDFGLKDRDKVKVIVIKEDWLCR